MYMNVNNYHSRDHNIFETTDCKPIQITLVNIIIVNLMDICVQITFYVVHRFNIKVMHIIKLFHLFNPCKCDRVIASELTLKFNDRIYVINVFQYFDQFMNLFQFSLNIYLLAGNVSTINQLASNNFIVKSYKINQSTWVHIFFNINNFSDIRI